MSKRKNTLNDLEEFLKLQASTLVPPQPVEPAITKEETIAEPVSKPVEIAHPPEYAHQPLDLIAELKKTAGRSKAGFYDFIVRAVESLPDNNPNDILLINTALYLKHGDNWKQGIEEYWRKRKTLTAKG